MIWSLTAWQVDASLLILQFTSQTPLQTFPDVSIESVENGAISQCFDAQIMTNTQNTVWTVECQLTDDQDISLGFTVHLSEAFSGTVSTISQGQNASS